MVKLVLHFLLTLPLIFGNYHQYHSNLSTSSIYHGLPGYIVAMPDEQIGIFGDTEISCRTVCRILSVEGVPYEGCSLYSTTEIDLTNCHDGFFLVGKEIKEGTYKIINNSPLAQSVRKYNTTAVYTDANLLESYIVEPNQEIIINLKDCILYIEKCSITTD